ncbi:MAG: NHL repeat-containing protein, partial [Candidatus Sumerlaeia bacterium]|nr:NHL repeat-containing protein [Candidatus Sumerlaeia bacterium]
ANIYVADLQRRTILVLDFKGKFLHILGQRKSENVLFNSPSALFLDKDLFIFVAEAENSQIKKFSTTGRLWLTFPLATNINIAKLKFPLDVKVSPRDNIYVADNGNFRIAIFDQKGKFLTELYWRDKNNQPLVIPRKLGFDPQGNLFILDQLHRRLLKIPARVLKF